jgi:ATP-dependent Clp protease, protease subunit
MSIPVMTPAIQLPLSNAPKPPAFVSFCADINPQTTEVLLGNVASLISQGFRNIHLLLSTPGGSVQHGITMYNLLRGMPIELTTHNVGNVDSIGTVVFLAGTIRRACPQATFMQHGVAAGIPGPAQFFEKNLQETLASVQADQGRIADIYKDRAGIDKTDAEKLFLGETRMTAVDAKARGLVHEISEVSIPYGSPVLQLVFNRQGGMHIR